MVTVDDFAAFLAARYDEAEAMAKACADSSGNLEWLDSRVTASGDHTIRTAGGSRPVARIRLADSVALDGRTLDADANAAFIAANDPARRLADVKLKRAILAEHASDCCVKEIFCGEVESWYSASRDDPCATVRQLGTEFAEHAGYRPEWRPE